MAKALTARIQVSLLRPLERSKAVTWTIHVSRARETHDGRIMNLHRDAHVGLVSNPSDREMQGSSAHTAAPDLDAWNSSWVEPLAGKRDIGHLNNRKLIDLSDAGIPILAHLAISTNNWEYQPTNLAV